MKILKAIALVTLFLTGLTLNAQREKVASYKTIKGYQDAMRRETEAKKIYNDQQWQTALDNYTAIITYWEKTKFNKGGWDAKNKEERLASLYVDRGDCYKHLNNFKKAESDYTKSFSVIENTKILAPYDTLMRSFKPVLAFARLYSEKDDYASAVKEMDNYINRVASYLMSSYTGEFLDTAKRVRKLDKYAPEEWIAYYQAFYYRGLYYYYLQEYQKASEDFKVAVMTATIHTNPLDDKGDPWTIITNTARKVTGTNPYVKIIRETDSPGIFEIVGNDGLNLYRNHYKNSYEKELIFLAGTYTIKAPDIDRLEYISGSRVVLGFTEYKSYREVFRAGEVFHTNYNFLAGNVYSVKQSDISVLK